MNEFIQYNFKHILCFLVFISRLGDIGSTYLVTPSLKLEANPMIKKLGWKFAIPLSILLCFVPYFHTGAAMIVLVPSLLISASNIAKIWSVKSIGEDEYLKMLLKLAQKSKLSQALLCILMSSFFVFLTGSILLFLYPSSKYWGYWFGIGIIVYAFATALHCSIYFCRLFKKATELGEIQP